MSTSTISSMSGLEQLRAAFSRPERTGIADLLDMSLVSLEAGAVSFRLQPSSSMLNPIGTVHGGVLAALLDSVASCAVHSALPPGVTYTTAQLNIHYIRPVLVDGGPITGAGRTVHVGRTVATAEASVTGPGDKLVAHGTVTCAIRTLGQP